MLAWKYVLSWFYLVFTKKPKELKILIWSSLSLMQKNRHLHKVWLSLLPLSFENSWTPCLLEQSEKCEAVHFGHTYTVSFGILQILTVRSIPRRVLLHIIKTCCSVTPICFSIMQSWPLQQKKAKSNVSQCWFTFPCLLNCSFCFPLFECYPCFHSWAITYLLSF